MCQVGSGFTDVDRAYLYEKLAGNTCERPPPCYKIRDPLKSVVLEVHADLRLVRSKVYASDYSLRFPRFDRI
ncbi:hypothetical protein CHLNCDRAFT_138400, partial [Chlorella variabilis]